MVLSLVFAAAPLLSYIDTTTELKIKQSDLYLKANYYQHAGQFHKALKVYNDLFVLDAPSHVYDGYLRLLSQTNQFEAISVLVDKTREHFKDDLEIQMIYVQSLLNTNRDVQARAMLDELKQKHPDNEQIAYYSAAHNEKTNNLPKALEDINKFLAKKNNRKKFFLFYFLKAKILLKMSNHSGAIAAIDKSLKLHPKFDKGILFKALLLEQTKQVDQAIVQYRKYLSLVKYDPMITKQLIQLLFLQRKFEEAAKELKKFNVNTAEHHTDLALLYWKAKKYQDAIKSVDKALAIAPLFENALQIKIELCIALKKHKEIVPLMKNWLVKQPGNNSTIKLLLKLCMQANIISLPQAITILEAAHKQHPTLYTLPLALGDVHLKTKQYRKALKQYEQAHALTKNHKLQARLSFQIGFVQMTMGHTKQAAETLDQALTKQTVYPQTYNLMAYLLSQDKKRTPETLARALGLIDKALATNPKSAHFLDTKATILEKQGKRPEAIKILDTGLGFAPNDSILKKHKHDAKLSR